MNKKTRFISFVLALVAMLCLSVPCFAEDGVTGAGDTFTIPVTLSIVKTTKHINVTLPAAFPVSVLDDEVLTADNLRIINNSKKLAVQVTGLEVTDGNFDVVSYEHFPETENGKIALWINGCGTEASGNIAITETAFPVIEVGGSLPIRYNAKVSESDEVTQTNAANVIFTLKAVSM